MVVYYHYQNPFLASKGISGAERISIYDADFQGIIDCAPVRSDMSGARMAALVAGRGRNAPRGAGPVRGGGGVVSTKVLFGNDLQRGQFVSVLCQPAFYPGDAGSIAFSEFPEDFVHWIVDRIFIEIGVPSFETS